MTTLNIGLLGAGRIGKVHGAAISETAGARLAAVADAFPEPANELADIYVRGGGPGSREMMFTISTSPIAPLSM